MNSAMTFMFGSNEIRTVRITELGAAYRAVFDGIGTYCQSLKVFLDGDLLGGERLTLKRNTCRLRSGNVAFFAQDESEQEICNG